MTLTRREREVVRRDDPFVECDYCGRTIRPDEAAVGLTDWTTSDLRRGGYDATLCGRCSGLALVHCWRCGALTGAIDSGTCPRCEEEIDGGQ